MASLDISSPISGRSRLEEQFSAIGFPGSFASDLLSHSTPLHFSKGSMLFLSGSPADVLFYVLKGLVKVYYPGADGSRLMVTLAGAGDLLGYVNYLDSRGRRAQVFEAEALTKTSAALFTRDHVLKLLRSLDGPMLINIMSGINTAWSSVAQRLAMLLSVSFRQRLELVLAELAERYGVREGRGILITPELTHDDLAEMIGSSRPMITRIFADMIKEGVLIRQRKQIILVDSLTGKTAASDLPIDRKSKAPAAASAG
jgi:CRP/FNR family transcriptional regulator, cyclic AMP receptor protein